MNTHNELAYGDEHPVAKAIRNAIGASDFEQVQVVLPKFERDDGIKVQSAPPKDFRAWDALREIPKEWLLSLGLRIWDVEDGQELWLYPHEWYDHIPNGYEVTDIFFAKKLFEHGKTDDDKRFGMLSFGFVRKHQP